MTTPDGTAVPSPATTNLRFQDPLDEYRWDPAIRFAMIVLGTACLYWAQPVLIPAALAILLTFILSPLVIGLQRMGLRRTPAVLAVTFGAATLVIVLATVMGLQFLQLAEELPKYEGKITRQIAEIRKQGEHSSLAKLAGLWKVVSDAATEPATDSGQTSEKDALPVKVVETGSWSVVGKEGLRPLVEPLAAAVLVLVLVVFLLVSREDAYDRLLCLFGSGRVLQTTKALHDAGRRISRYLLAQFIVNVGCGICIGIGLLVLQVPYAPLWGFFTVVLRYIPVMGPWIAAVAPLSLSLMVFEGWLPAAKVIAVFLVIELSAAMVAEPYLYGQSIGVSKSALLVAMAFWTWLWGAIGLILAAPLTVCVVVFAKHVPAWRILDVLLGDAPSLPPSKSFYQRLIARDDVGAIQVLHDTITEGLTPQVYDEIVLPALSFVKRDLDSGELDEAEGNRILASFKKALDRKREVRADSTNEDVPGESNTAARVNILAVPAGDVVDRYALELLMPLLNPRLFNITIASEEQLVAEIVAKVEMEPPHMVLIASVPPGGRAMTRLLCKRLRKSQPALKIILSHWLGGLHGEVESPPPFDAGEDAVMSSFEEALEQINRLIYLRSLASPSPARQPEGLGLAAVEQI